MKPQGVGRPGFGVTRDRQQCAGSNRRLRQAWGLVRSSGKVSRSSGPRINQDRGEVAPEIPMSVSTGSGRLAPRRGTGELVGLSKDGRGRERRVWCGGYGEPQS